MTEFHETYPHLYHYTNSDGLKGILESQTLWATHFRHLNDSSEIELMRPFLEENLLKFLIPFYQQVALASCSDSKIIEQHGGIRKAARNDAKHLINSGYIVNFLGDPTIVPATEPYILSFCAHTRHNKYVKENSTNDYTGFALSDVVYDDQYSKCKTEFASFYPAFPK